MANSKLLTVHQLAERFGWSIQKVYRMVAAKAIPHLRIPGEGRKSRGPIYFEEAQLEAWLEAKRVGAAESSQHSSQHRSTRKRSHAEECEWLGIPVDHMFATE